DRVQSRVAQLSDRHLEATLRSDRGMKLKGPLPPNPNPLLFILLYRTE
ncbi:MAG: hypothetical protein F6K35_38085, partial [Okeania sp. SIO2H7]|nr:hypothetical protein [Okeania sp. SIO2H7]